MTINEQVALATDKVAHWNSKRDHAQAMLTKWESRRAALQAKGGEPQRTEEADGNVVPIKGQVREAKKSTRR